jgi:ADP-ribose pyrophosphatase YjhB (NUDIX family)
MTEPKWLEWARELQSIAQMGLTYSEGVFDRERYEQIRHIAAAIIAAGSDQPLDTVIDLLKNEPGPNTPKVDVRGVVFRDDAILMVRETLDNNRWTLPGGWADVNETPAQAVAREVWEESGFRTRAVKLLALYDKQRHDHPPGLIYVYKVFFLCEITGGEAQGSIETSEVAFFREADLPDDLSRGRISRRQLHRFFEHRRNPHLPTDFD